jgi:dTDP-glucose 4,6-dehydratase
MQVRDWLYVQDNCEGIQACLEKGRAGEVYNIGGGNELTNMELTKLILKELGKGEEMIEHVKDRPGHDRRYALDCSKIRGELGWKPRFEFQGALKETVNWYRQNQEWWKPLRR